MTDVICWPIVECPWGTFFSLVGRSYEAIMAEEVRERFLAGRRVLRLNDIRHLGDLRR